MASYKVVGVGEHGKYFDSTAYQDTLNYITNPEKAAYTGACNLMSVETAAQEMEHTAESFGKNCGKRVRHSVLSFSQADRVTPEQADRYAQEILQHYAPDFQLVYAVHTNTEDVHVHMVMNQIAYTDGHRYRGKKGDYHAFLRHMKQVTHRPVIAVK